MTHTKANKTKILALVLGLTMCISLMLGIVFASPTNNEKVSGKIATESTDTGMWISGAPGPYTYEAKIAPIGMDVTNWRKIIWN